MLTYNPPAKEVLEKDTIFDEAVKFVTETGKASATVLQRHFMLGYARAARLLDELEQEGVVGPVRGASPREVLNPPKKPEPVENVQYKEPPIRWNKTKYANNKTDNFEIEIGTDENNKKVNLDLERYGNLLIIGSQFTSAVDLLNSILATSMAKYSPEELRFIVVDGIKGDLIVPNQASHLLTPMIIEPEKTVSALMWCAGVVEKRMKMENLDDQPKIVILINAFNQILSFSPAEVGDNLYRIMTQGRKYGFFFVIGTDYPNPRIMKEIVANSPAKLVFKPTDKKIGRETGIPESVDLVSPDEAILETMFEGKKKITINKVNPKEIYDEIFK